MARACGLSGERPVHHGVACTCVVLVERGLCLCGSDMCGLGGERPVPVWQ